MEAIFLPCRVSVTALRGDHFPPRLHMFRNYSAPYERMEQLVAELIEARSLLHASSPTHSRGPSPHPPPHYSSPDTATAAAATANSKNSQVVNENPMATDVPYNRLLTSFLQDLFGETIKEVGNGGGDECDLQESAVALLSSFSRRYVSGSERFEKQAPIDKQVGAE